MGNKYSIVIGLDPSEKTYEYHLQKNGEDFLMGDGYESPEEISKELLELQEILNGVDLTLGKKDYIDYCDVTARGRNLPGHND